MLKEKSIFIVAEDEVACNEDVAFCIEEEQMAFDKPELEFLFNTKLPEGKDGEEAKEKLEEENKSWLETHDVEKFHDFLQEEMDRIKSPLAARSSLSEMERAYNQWLELDKNVSKALRSDYESKLNVPVIDKQRVVIQNNIDQLQYLLDGIKKTKRNRKAEDNNGDIIKEANTPKHTGLQTIMTLFESAIVRSLINGVVSGGRNMEELFEIAKEKYDISEREELAIFQAITDLGYPTFKDRLRIGDDDQDVSDSENFGEWQTQYYS